MVFEQLKNNLNLTLRARMRAHIPVGKKQKVPKIAKEVQS